jgi:hypothetical protein
MTMPENTYEERRARFEKFAALTSAEVQDLLEAEYDPYPEGHEQHGDPVSGEDVWHEWEKFESRDVPGLGKVTVVEHVGGGEGEGERLYKVVRVEGDPYGVRYFQMDGWYMSYDGSHYDGDLFEVEPVETVVTIWRRV